MKWIFASAFLSLSTLTVYANDCGGFKGLDREAYVARLKNEKFDVLVVGGGATGTGAALEAASRGLKVALVERNDFASGTSSRSTKLIHGGVRYLEMAVKHLDRGQLHLVRDALHERSTLFRTAPHLVHALPLATPIYGNPFAVPYYLMGLKMYDLLARESNLPGSRYMTPGKTLSKFPMLQPKGLRGSVVYYDGQFDDARLNVTLALSAADEGAAVANHVAVESLSKDDEGKLNGATVRDALTGDSWNIPAKVVVNASGPFGDGLRKMDDAGSEPMLKASSGSHLVLDPKFTPPDTGMLIPKTKDGRVLFVLPWNGHTLVGTTDNAASVTDNPKPSPEDVRFILDQMGQYYSQAPTESDIRAAWTGLRPLVAAKKGAGGTAKLSRDHVIEVSPSNLVTIAGGKWTTYRSMGRDAIDRAVQVGSLAAGPSRTQALKLAGAEHYDETLAPSLSKEFGVDADVADYLSHAYGDRSRQVLELGRSEGLSQRLASGHPYLEAEVLYAVRHEAARSAVDVLARRLRLSFLDRNATMRSIPRVVQMMGDALSWDSAKRDEETRRAEEYFR